MDEANRIFSVDDWCAGAGLSRAWYYLQPIERRPRSVKIGKTLRILETPREYAERMALAAEKGSPTAQQPQPSAA